MGGIACCVFSGRMGSNRMALGNGGEQQVALVDIESSSVGNGRAASHLSCRGLLQPSIAPYVSIQKKIRVWIGIIRAGVLQYTCMACNPVLHFLESLARNELFQMRASHCTWPNASAMAFVMKVGLGLETKMRPIVRVTSLTYNGRPSNACTSTVAHIFVLDSAPRNTRQKHMLTRALLA
jgi:hypothetical protein